MQRTLRASMVLIAGATICGCSQAPYTISSPQAYVGATISPALKPRAVANDAPPQLLAVAFSSLQVRRGTHWTGSFVTSTNVASVEVRTPLFSIDVPRTSFGRFAYSVDVLDLPPIFVRGYRLEVIARNTAGAQAVQELPFRIH